MWIISETIHFCPSYHIVNLGDMKDYDTRRQICECDIDNESDYDNE